MKIKYLLFTIIALTILGGCTQNIPMRTGINEFVLMNIRTSSHRGVDFDYDTEIVSNELPLYGQNKAPYYSGGMKYTVEQNAALKSMLTQYLSNKFHEISPMADLKMEITLEDFYVERYVTDSGAVQALALFAGESDMLSYLTTAYVTITVSIDNYGETLTKTLTASADETGNSEGDAVTIGKAINRANNNILMLLNAWLEENL